MGQIRLSGSIDIQGLTPGEVQDSKICDTTDFINKYSNLKTILIFQKIKKFSLFAYLEPPIQNYPQKLEDGIISQGKIENVNSVKRKLRKPVS